LSQQAEPVLIRRRIAGRYDLATEPRGSDAGAVLRPSESRPALGRSGAEAQRQLPGVHLDGIGHFGRSPGHSGS